MKWSEVRKLHPDKFVLLENLKDHVEGNFKYVDEVALIDVIDDDKEASNLLVRCKGDRFHRERYAPDGSHRGVRLRLRRTDNFA